jgi:curli production assembly/transport component CsgF
MPAGAGELIYQPVNPNFGGNPFNGTPLLNNALAQNNFKDPELKSRTSQSSAESFEQRLDRAILSQLSRDLVTTAFGSGTITDGTFDTGVNTITIVTGLNETTITIVDNATGEITTVEVPFF